MTKITADGRPRTPQRTWHGFALILASLVASTGAGFGFKIIIARTLGSDMLGAYVVCTLLTVVVGTLCDVGLRQCLVSTLPTSTASALRRARLSAAATFKLSVALAVAALLGLLASPLATICFGKPTLIAPLRLTALGIVCWSLWDLAEIGYQVEQRFATTTAYRLATDCARLVGLGLLAHLQVLGLMPVLGLWLLMPLAAWGLATWRQPLGLQATWGEPGELAGLLRYGRWVFVYRGLTMLLMVSDSLAMSRLLSLQDLGQYEAAKGLAYTLVMLNESLAYVLLPRLTESTGRADLWDVARRFMMAFGALLLFALGLTLIGPTLLTLFGHAFRTPATLQVLQILVPGCVLGLLSTFVSTVWLSRGQPQRCAQVAALQMLGALLIYPWAIRTHGMVGAAATNAALSTLGAALFALQALPAVVRYLRLPTPPAAESRSLPPA